MRERLRMRKRVHGRHVRWVCVARPRVSEGTRKHVCVCARACVGNQKQIDGVKNRLKTSCKNRPSVFYLPALFSKLFQCFSSLWFFPVLELFFAFGFLFDPRLGSART